MKRAATVLLLATAAMTAGYLYALDRISGEIAATNEAGKGRMRAARMRHLIAEIRRGEAAVTELRNEMNQMDRRYDALEAAVATDDLRAMLAADRHAWRTEIEPAIEAAIDGGASADDKLEGFITMLDRETVAFEREAAESTGLLRTGMVLFALILLGVVAAAFWSAAKTKGGAEQRARLQAIFDTAVDAIVTIDERGAIDSVNPAAERMFGWARAEMIGSNVSMLMPSPDRERHDGYLRRYQETGERRIIGIGREATAMRRDGTPFPVELAVNEIRLADRRMFAGVIRDLSERKQLERQLQHAQKMETIGQMAGGIAHDFSNIVTGIAMSADVLIGRLAADDPARALGDEIRDSARRAKTLTSQLLVFSRAQVIDPRVLDVNDLVRDTDSMVRRLIGEEISVVLALEARGRIRADAGQIQQVLMNLVLNARDAMPRGGTLRVRTADEDGRVMLSVSDTGEGMDAAVRERIFDPFFTTKDAGHGTGLGLAIVDAIVRKAGGTIRVESEPGAGADFRILLPRVDEEPRPRPEPPPPSMRPLSILVVEDEAPVRAAIVRALADWGHRVIEVDDSRDAERSVNGIDLLITDVVMPGLDGREVARRVRERKPSVSVLFISGYPPDRGPAPAPGSSFLQKPFTREELWAKIAEATAYPHPPSGGRV